jgi:hypothetical protein
MVLADQNGLSRLRFIADFLIRTRFLAGQLALRQGHGKGKDNCNGNDQWSRSR